MKEQNKKYNAADFARYHSGEMSADEMHALEKAALYDPFLADALEGYAYAKDPEEELEEIKLRLSDRKNDQKVFNLSGVANSTWWKIAAIFILIAGSAYLFLITNTREERSLAVKQDSAIKKTESVVSQLNKNTAAAEDNVAFENTVSKQTKTHPGESLDRTTKTENILQKKGSELKESKIENDKVLSEKPIIKQNENVIALNQDRVKSANPKVMDLAEKSFFISSDTNKSNSISLQEVIKDSGKQLVINEEPPALNEVVVNGYGSKRKASKKLEGKVSGIVSESSPYPKGGKENFDQYIKDSAAVISDSNGTQLQADILLSFIVDKKGVPSKIKTLESNCKACEKEAIRLLENGPEWIGKPGTMATVRLKF